MVTINFDQEPMFMKELNIENIGEFAIEAWNDEGMYYYYVVRTSLGLCSIAQSGPKIPDIELLPKTFSQCRYQMTYKEDKLSKDVAIWLNDRYKKITNAQIVDVDYAIDQFVNLKDYLENYSEELY